MLLNSLPVYILFLPLLNFLFCILGGRIFGQYGIKKITLVTFSLTTIFSYILFYFITKYNLVVYLNFGNWISSHLLLIDWNFIFDALTVSMLLIVTLISTLVHLYSFDYMGTDPHFNRFISYLSLFTFFMLILISADNLVCMFVGWEGVGICSYLLINFWFTRIQANKSAIKALLMNRFGDCGVLFGILILANVYETVDISILSLLIPLTIGYTVEFFSYTFSIIDVVAVAFFIGTIGKSAQLGLHTWLPSAMEGPTPVSALIHAATMVTAGIFLLIRTSFIFEFSNILPFIVVWGALTSIFAALLALVQHDIKKIIAYSTCSQLGYMTMACGVSNYLGSLYHLVNHAFFKALLFLSAGVIIHFLSNEQDLRKMGNLKNFLPFTYSVMLIATLAITGFPFLSGFYSKDIIIENLFIVGTVSSNFSFWVASLTALLTSYYSWRLVYYIFFNANNGLRINYKFNNHVEMAPYTFIPLFILAFGSIFSGYFLSDIFINLNSSILLNSIMISPQHYTLISAEFLPFYIKLIPTLFSFFGFCFFMYFKNNSNLLVTLKYQWNFFYNFLLQHGFFDLVYNNFAKFFLLKAYTDIFILIDKGLLEKLGPYSFDLYYQKLIYFFYFSLKNNIQYYLVILFYFLLVFFYVFIKTFMKFIDKKYLLQQHRFVSEDHPVQNQRRKTLAALKRWTSILNRANPYDEYFMNWFCGFIDSFVFFKILKKQKIQFFFLAYHIDYKLLKWVRYQLNFGFVYPSDQYYRGCFVVTRRSHLLILIEILNGYMLMKRSLMQFYVWLEYYKIVKNISYTFMLPQQPNNLVRSTYLMGLMDCLGRFHIYRKPDKRYKFKYRIRFFFYMDIPITEMHLIKKIANLFVSPYIYIHSGNTIRFILSKIDDCSILSGLLIRRRPFNRYLKLRFINWYCAVQYLHFKNIKYPRKDRVMKLLYNFRNDYYYVPPRKKQPSPLIWYLLPEDIKVD